MGILPRTHRIQELTLESGGRGGSRPQEGLAAWLYDSVILDIAPNCHCKTVHTNSLYSDFHLSGNWNPEFPAL